MKFINFDILLRETSGVNWLAKNSLNFFDLSFYPETKYKLRFTS